MLALLVHNIHNNHNNHNNLWQLSCLSAALACQQPKVPAFPSNCVQRVLLNLAVKSVLPGLESVQHVLPDLAVHSLHGLGPGSGEWLPACNRAGHSRGTEVSKAAAMKLAILGATGQTGETSSLLHSIVPSLTILTPAPTTSPEAIAFLKYTANAFPRAACCASAFSRASRSSALLIGLSSVIGCLTSEP